MDHIILGSVKMRKFIYLAAALLQKADSIKDPGWWEKHSAVTHLSMAEGRLIDLRAALDDGDKITAAALTAELGLSLVYAAAQAGLLTDELLPAVARPVPPQVPEKEAAPPTDREGLSFFGSS